MSPSGVVPRTPGCETPSAYPKCSCPCTGSGRTAPASSRTTVQPLSPAGARWRAMVSSISARVAPVRTKTPSAGCCGPTERQRVGSGSSSTGCRAAIPASNGSRPGRPESPVTPSLASPAKVKATFSPGAGISAVTPRLRRSRDLGPLVQHGLHAGDRQPLQERHEVGGRVDGEEEQELVLLEQAGEHVPLDPGGREDRLEVHRTRHVGSPWLSGGRLTRPSRRSEARARSVIPVRVHR